VSTNDLTQEVIDNGGLGPLDDEGAPDEILVGLLMYPVTNGHIDSLKGIFLFFLFYILFSRPLLTFFFATYFFSLFAL
jgi:hypothetical protein